MKIYVEKMREMTLHFEERTLFFRSLIIEHELSVEDTVQARILCGVRNRLVLRLQQNVAWNLEQLWGVRPIHLHIWVKVRVIAAAADSHCEAALRAADPQFLAVQPATVASQKKNTSILR